MQRTKATWEKIYQEGKTPWDFKQAEPYLVKLKIKPCHALDIGCGPGNESILLAKQGFNVTGIDISENAIAKARERAITEKVNVEFIATDILDFKPINQYDFVLDRACFHFLGPEERQKYIQVVTNSLNQNGLFLLFVSSDKETSKGPYQFSEKKLRELFNPYFKIEKIELITLETHLEKPMPYVCQFRKR